MTNKKEMKRSRSFSLLFYLYLLVIVFSTFSIVSVEARKTNTKKKLHKPHKGGHTRGSHSPCPVPAPQGSTFDVLAFGAKGNGVSDDSEVNKERKNILRI